MSVTCSDFENEIYHFQADELASERRRLLQEHLDGCPACARRLAVEASFLAGIKQRLVRDEAPVELRSRVRAALRNQAPSRPVSRWMRAPWLTAAAASLLLGLLLLPGLSGRFGAGWTGWAGAVHVVREAIVVDLDCDREGLTVKQQRGCRHPQHVNALKVGDGRYWSLSLDREDGRRIALDRDLRGHRMQVEGDLYTRIHTIGLTAFEDLGLQ